MLTKPLRGREDQILRDGTKTKVSVALLDVTIPLAFRTEFRAMSRTRTSMPGRDRVAGSDDAQVGPLGHRPKPKPVRLVDRAGDPPVQKGVPITHSDLGDRRSQGLP